MAAKRKFWRLVLLGISLAYVVLVQFLSQYMIVGYPLETFEAGS